MTPTAARVALVGDRSASVQAHARIPRLFGALLARDGIALDAYWIPSQDAASSDLAGFDAIWVVPGSPYASEEGVIGAVRTAREQQVPFLGTCGGFQHALLEYARDVCGLTAVQHAESHPDAGDLLLVPLACSLVGHEEAVMVVPGTRAASIIGPGRRVERYHCVYGLNDAYLETLVNAGLRFSGFDDAGQVRILEIPGHPFFIGTLFQPELHGDGTSPHPLITAFAVAAADRAKTSVALA